MIFNPETKDFELIHYDDEPRQNSYTSENKGAPEDSEDSQQNQRRGSYESFTCTHCGTINTPNFGSNATSRSRGRSRQDPPSGQVLNASFIQKLMDRDGYSYTSSGGLLSHDYFKLLSSTIPKDAQHNQQKLKLLNDGNNFADDTNSIPIDELINQGYFDKFFKIVNKLGNGSFGQVYKVEHEILGINLGSFALKKIPIGNDRQNLFKTLNEVLFLYNLSNLSSSAHSNVIKYNHVWIEKSKINDFGPEIPMVFLLFEYCDGGTLEEYIEKVVHPKFDLSKERLLRRLKRKGSDVQQQSTGRMLTNLEILKIFRDICQGLKYLHDLKIIHRDLKPSNCLFKTKFGSFQPVNDTNGLSSIPTLLVSDFGESIYFKQNSHQLRSGNTGTLEYCAPELLKVDASGQLHDFTFASDIYSLGMILYYLCFGKLPYKTEGDVKEEIINGGLFDGIISTNESNDWIDLIEQMVRLDFDKRPTIDEVLLQVEIISSKILNVGNEDSESLISDDELEEDLDNSLNFKHKDQMLSEFFKQYTTGVDSSMVLIIVLTICNLLLMNELKWSNWVHLEFLILGVSLGTSYKRYKFWLIIIQSLSMVVSLTTYLALT